MGRSLGFKVYRGTIYIARYVRSTDRCNGLPDRRQQALESTCKRVVWAPDPCLLAPTQVMSRQTTEITKRHYETLAAWRHALRRFLHFSHEAAEAAGIPPQQHQVLLVIKGFPDREYATVGEIAERMYLKHHSAVGLVDRLVKRQLIERQSSRADRRRVEVRLTSRGEALIQRLSAAHLRELRQLQPELQRLLDSVDAE